MKSEQHIDIESAIIVDLDTPSKDELYTTLREFKDRSRVIEQYIDIDRSRVFEPIDEITDMKKRRLD